MEKGHHARIARRKLQGKDLRFAIEFTEIYHVSNASGIEHMSGKNVNVEMQ